MQKLDRRQMLSYAAFSPAIAGAIGSAADAATADSATTADNSLARASKRYAMKKSINLWAFPYPSKMNLRQCLELAKRAGFDGIELNFDLDSDLSPKATSQDFANIRKMADEIGIAISGFNGDNNE